MQSKVKTAAMAIAVAVVLVTGLKVFFESTKSKANGPKEVVSAQVTSTPVVAEVKVKPQYKIKRIEDIEVNRRNAVLLNVGIDYRSVTATIAALRKLSPYAEAHYLLLDSPGGSVFDGAQLISYMEASPVPVHTVCVGFCASMAAHIHAHGAKRYMTDRAILLYHPARGGVQGEFENIISQVNFIARYVGKLDAYIAQRSGMPLAEFKAKLRDELTLDSEDATDLKFNDAIVALDSDGVDSWMGELDNSKTEGTIIPGTTKTTTSNDSSCRTFHSGTTLCVK